MNGQVSIIGMACSRFADDHESALDEIVFDTTTQALADAGIRKGDLDLSLFASYDLYEGRTISYGMTLPAAGGYLTDEYRLQNDGSAVLINAVAAIAGNNAEVAIVTAMNKPEILPQQGPNSHAFFEQMSNYSFDPHFVRPTGATGTALLAMHAARAVSDERASVSDLARAAAGEISRGAQRLRGYRASMSVDEVLDAGFLAWPLTGPMLPAMSSGVVSLILASDARARRCRQIHATVRGSGTSLTPYTWNPEWLNDPAASTRRAAARAYQQAGIGDPGGQVQIAEISALTPALHGPIVNALQLDTLDEERINPSGGVRSNFPGLANGLLRVVETIDSLRAGTGGGIGVAHAVDYLLGPASSNASVVVVEA